MATVTTILDQMHAINESLAGGLTAQRYFPTNVDELALFIVPIPGDASYSAAPGTQRVHVTRSFQSLVVMGAFTEGRMVEDAQDVLEAQLETISDDYLSRPRLEVAGQGLAGVIQHLITDDAIGPQDIYNTQYIVLTIEHSITYRKSITYNTS